MVKYFITIILAFASLSGMAQELERLTLQQSYELSRNNYPLIKQQELVRKTAAINIDNLRKGYLPQLTLSGQASYQSDVTSIPIAIPNFTIETPSKDQYKLLADVSQLIYDGGITKQQQQLQTLNATVEEQKIEVELYKVKERINQLYLSILYLDEQHRQVALVEADINTGIKRVQAQVDNGVSFRSSLDMLKAELLRNGQRSIDIQSSRKGLVDALALFIGASLRENVQLERPGSIAVSIGQPITRPEMKLFTEQDRLADQQHRIIRAKNQPKANLFLQGGYGRPGLNLLKNAFDFYYIGGLRFNWSLGALYTRKKEKELVEVTKKVIGVQQETFVLNTITQLKQQQSEIDRLLKLIESDYQIIALRASVKTAAKAQLENGVITANDFLKEVNAEDQARQSQITHQVQLLQAQINYQTISGK